MRKTSVLLPKGICDIPSGMGRKLEWPEKFLTAYAAGTLERIRAVLAEGEDVRAFIRAAVERELARRKRVKKRSPEG